MSTTAVPTLCVKCGLPIVGHISYIGTSCASPHHPECLGQKSYYELEQQLTAEREAREKAEAERDGLKSMIAFTPNGCKVIDAAMARIDVLQDDNQTVSLAAYEATSYAMYAMEKERDQWRGIAEDAANEFMLEQELHNETTIKLKSAEQKLREAQEQEPVCWRREWNGDVSDYGNYIHADSKEDLDRNGQWQPLYAAPILPADVAELQRENEQYAKDVLQLIKQLRYCIGIAERGTGRDQREDEIGELFLLEYVKELERKLAE